VRATGAEPRGGQNRQEIRISLEWPILLGGAATARNTLVRPRAADIEHRDPIREVPAHHMAHAPVVGTTSSRVLPRAAAGSVTPRGNWGGSARFPPMRRRAAYTAESSAHRSKEPHSRPRIPQRCSTYCLARCSAIADSLRGRLLLRREVCSITPFPFSWRPLISADAGEPDCLANSGARPLSIGPLCINHFRYSSGSYA
jgi:hypothetical protein